MTQMPDRDRDLDGMDDLFALARQRPAEPSEALMRRVLEDGLALQPPPRPLIAPTPPASRGLWRALADLFGGVAPLAGIGTAAAAGLVLGFVQPQSLSDLSAALMGGQIDSISVLPSVDDLFAEVSQ